MPFDGIAYRPQLVYPIHGYPTAPATARALATSLANAYAYARSANRLIGVQTSNIIGSVVPFLDRNGANNAVDNTGFVPVARFRRRLDAHANHVLAQGVGRFVRGEGGAEIRMRVVVTDGTNTDTGGSIVSAAPESNDGAADELFEAAALVELRNVVLPAVCTVTVEAYAVDPEDTGESGGLLYFETVSCWYESVG